MATSKKLSFIKAICKELGIEELKEDILIWKASKFISKYSTTFYAKKARDKENKLKKNNDSHKYKHWSSFKADKKLLEWLLNKMLKISKINEEIILVLIFWANKKR